MNLGVLLQDERVEHGKWIEPNRHFRTLSQGHRWRNGGSRINRMDTGWLFVQHSVFAMQYVPSTSASLFLAQGCYLEYALPT